MLLANKRNISGHGKKKDALEKKEKAKIEAAKRRRDRSRRIK